MLNALPGNIGAEREVKQIDLIVASGQEFSEPLLLGGYTLIGVLVDPSGWDAAGLTVQVYVKGDWRDLKLRVDGSTAPEEFTIPSLTAGDFVELLPTDILAASRIRFRSGTSSAAVNQTADRTLTLIVRPL